VLWRMAIVLKANKVNLFVSSVLFVFWYHSPNFLDTPLMWTLVWQVTLSCVATILWHIVPVPWEMSKRVSWQEMEENRLPGVRKADRKLGLRDLRLSQQSYEIWRRIDWHIDAAPIVLAYTDMRRFNDEDTFCEMRC
jgi:hypothetical protein